MRGSISLDTRHMTTMSTRHRLMLEIQQHTDWEEVDQGCSDTPQVRDSGYRLVGEHHKLIFHRGDAVPICDIQHHSTIIPVRPLISNRQSYEVNCVPLDVWYKVLGSLDERRQESPNLPSLHRAIAVQYRLVLE